MPMRDRLYDPEMSPARVAERAERYNMEDLKFHVNALNEMLKDPQFGLVGWCMLYSEHMKYISGYWENN